jgi:ribosomal protein S18 acetylase RimI-like enzyme
MRIRRAGLADSRAIAEVHVTCWQESYAGLLPDSMLRRQTVGDREAQWRRVLGPDSRASGVFVAEDGPAIVGFAACGPRRSDALTQDSEIYALYVLRAHQRRGAGRALCRDVALALRGRGFRTTAAWVLRENAPARRFYEALGGRLVTERSLREGQATLVEIGYGWDELDSLIGAPE